MKNSIITLNSRPVGKPQLENFLFETAAMPEAQEGELLLKTLYVSVDPYLRGRMSAAESYAASYELHKPMKSGCIAEVVASKNGQFAVGDIVSGFLEWKEFQISDGEGLSKVDTEVAAPSAYLGLLGMTGLTAYLGLTEIGKPKAGETLVVSGAAGAVGSVAGQLGKIFGCRVVGIAGSDEKVALLKNNLGFDAAINYNTTTNMQAAIASACPDGVDVYFDNVGGEISDAVLMNLTRLSRVVVCGVISTYNATSPSMGPRVQSILVTKSALMQGFIVGNYASKFPEARAKLAQWFKEGKLLDEETIVEGFENIPSAFIGLFEGKNKGKMIVKV